MEKEKEDTDMDQATLTAALIAANAPVLTALKDLAELTKSLKPTEVKKEGDKAEDKKPAAAKKPITVAGIRKAALEKRRDAIALEVEEAGDDQELLEKAAEELQEIEEQMAQIDADAAKAKNLRKASNQNDSSGDRQQQSNGNDRGGVVTGLNKRDADLMGAGASFARSMYGGNKN